jgi:aminoglycoside 2'-N-acetyltransferase I
MSALHLRAVQTEDLAPGRLDELNALCEAAFDEPFSDQWARVGPGLHVIAERDGHAVAHAMIVDRVIYVGHEAEVGIDVGYVEHVATLPAEQGRGHGTATIQRIGTIIAEEYALGGLATGSNAFYARLGWETWRGPTSVRMPDGDWVRTPQEDGHIMVLRTPGTPAGLRLDGPIAVEWREGPW